MRQICIVASSSLPLSTRGAHNAKKSSTFALNERVCRSYEYAGRRINEPVPKSCHLQYSMPPCGDIPSGGSCSAIQSGRSTLNTDDMPGHGRLVNDANPLDAAHARTRRVAALRRSCAITRSIRGCFSQHTMPPRIHSLNCDQGWSLACEGHEGSSGRNAIDRFGRET